MLGYLLAVYSWTEWQSSWTLLLPGCRRCCLPPPFLDYLLLFLLSEEPSCKSCSQGSRGKAIFGVAGTDVYVRDWLVADTVLIILSYAVHVIQAVSAI